eukprot:672780-Prymnesium_polylepis.1
MGRAPGAAVTAAAHLSDSVDGAASWLYDGLHGGSLAALGALGAALSPVLGALVEVLRRAGGLTRRQAAAALG